MVRYVKNDGRAVAALAHFLDVFESILSTQMRLGVKESVLLTSKGNIASLMSKLDRNDEALAMQRRIYAQEVSLFGKQDERNLQTILNLSDMLIKNQDFAEARSLLRETIDVSRTVVGPENYVTFKLCAKYSHAVPAGLQANRHAESGDLLDAEKTLGDSVEKARRVLGPKNPVTADMLSDLTRLRKIIGHVRASGKGPI